MFNKEIRSINIKLGIEIENIIKIYMIGLGISEEELILRLVWVHQKYQTKSTLVDNILELPILEKIVYYEEKDGGITIYGEVIPLFTQHLKELNHE